MQTTARGIVFRNRQFTLSAWVLAIGVAVAVNVGALTPVQANTIRVANQGDVLSLDPHSLNEAVQLAFLNNVFESLVTRNKDLSLAPSLAVSWKATAPTVWRFDLRKGVQFHDGTAFNADDVLFSLDRARGDGADVRAQLASVKAVRKLNDYAVEVETTAPNPILPDVITNILIMSKTWALTNNALKPVDRRKGVENAASFKANGTGPYRVRERQPNIRTVLQRNPLWWGKNEGNIQEVVFQPINNDGTRVAALVAGNVDVIDPVPVQDKQRLAVTAGLKVQEAPESRVIFLGFDHKRDELIGSSVKGKNPFKDVKVRQAFYHAIDAQTIKTTIMRGSSQPTGNMIVKGIRGHSADLDVRLAYNPALAKQLLTQAGYPDGFEISMNCPNDRYVNDSDICQAVASYLAKIDVKVRLQAESKTTYFPRGLRREFGFFMLGWSPAGYDAHNLLFTVLATPSAGQGQWNFGAYSNTKVDELTQKIQSELDEKKRNSMIQQALQLHAADVGHIPLHQQTLSWGMRKDISAYQRADGFMLYKWMTAKTR